MYCPKCGSNARVMDTIPYSDTEIYRRRKCLECKHIFKSVEIIDEDVPSDKEIEFNRRYEKAYMSKSKLFKAEFERRTNTENH